MKNSASIDIGSNSCLLLVMNMNREVIHEESHITSLGKGIDKTKEFSEEAMKTTFQVLTKYSEECERLSVSLDEVIMTATEASRVATNSEQFYEKVEKDIGLKVKIISGEQEAFYTALGISEMANLSEDQFVIMDIGGASTEFILVNRSPFEIIDSISLPVGSARGTDWSEQGTFQEKIDEIYSSSNLGAYMSKPFICVAGTMTTVALMLQNYTTYDADKVNDLKLEPTEFKRLCDHLISQEINKLTEKFGFIGKRATTLKAGLNIANYFIENMKAESLNFSTFGLRYGTLIESMNKRGIE